MLEGRSFKGHGAPIRDIIKVGSTQFATCDENGMIVVWSKLKNQQKCVTAISRFGAEGANCIATGGKKNEWLVAGCNNGCVYFLNMVTAR